MGFDSESSCEEPDAIKKEATDEECIELTTDDNESPSKQYEKIHICAYEGCNKKFSRPSKLQAHLCYHTGERAFKCKHEGCDKSYSRPQHLRRHVATSHSKEAMYKKLLRCPYPDCMKELSNQQNLKKHYYRKHERKQPFTCEYCDKGFPKHQQLKQHLYQHTGIPPFSCSECNVGFTKIGDLNRHNRGHKTYTCSFADCGIVLKAWTHMRTHIKLKHPSEFPCDNCGRTFRTKSRLKIHATIHKEPDEREIFSCTYPNCPRFYFKKSNLTHHIKSSHEGKKFECAYEDCGAKLCSKEVDAAPTDKRKRKSVAEDSKLFQSSSDACSEREDIEKEHNKESGDFTETKSCPPSNDSLQANRPSKLSKSSKRNVSNRKLLAKFKKLKTAELSAKRSSTPSNCIPHIPSEQEDKINSLNTIFIQKEESLMALDTIYKEDKYIQDCLRVIDAKDLKLVEERSKTSDGIKLHHMDSEPDDIQNVINNRESCGTKVDKNITGILDTSSSLKHLFLRRKQKSLDQIVHSLRSVLENKLGGNNRSIPSSVNLDNVVAEDEENNKSKNSEAEYSKSCQESSNVHSLLHKHGEFCVGDSKLPECSVVGSNKNLRDLCALSQKAILKRTDDHVNSPTALREDTQVGYAKQQDIWRMSIHGDMTIKKWLQVMQKAMEDVYPYLKQHI